MSDLNMHGPHGDAATEGLEQDREALRAKLAARGIDLDDDQEEEDHEGVADRDDPAADPDEGGADGDLDLYGDFDEVGEEDSPPAEETAEPAGSADWEVLARDVSQAGEENAAVILREGHGYQDPQEFVDHARTREFWRHLGASGLSDEQKHEANRVFMEHLDMPVGRSAEELIADPTALKELARQEYQDAVGTAAVRAAEAEAGPDLGIYDDFQTRQD